MCLSGVGSYVVVLVCEVILVPYMVGAMVAVTVMSVLLFVFDVCMLRECGDERMTAMLARKTVEVRL